MIIKNIGYVIWSFRTYPHLTTLVVCHHRIKAEDRGPVLFRNGWGGGQIFKCISFGQSNIPDRVVQSEYHTGYSGDKTIMMNIPLDLILMNRIFGQW